MILIPLIVMALGVTYATFSDKVNIGTLNKPDYVYTGYMKWKAYLPSQLGKAWKSHMPDETDGVIVHSPPHKYMIRVPERPDVGKINVSVSGTTAKMTISNAYPGYAADAHYVFIYSGSVPTKIKSVYIRIHDPKGIRKDLKTDIRMTVDTDGKNGPSPAEKYVIVGYPLSKLPGRLEYHLKNKVFTHGGYIAFCTPPNVTSLNTTYDICPNSSLSPALISLLKNTDSFWIICTPDRYLPQNATMSFNLTLVFTQYNG